MERKQLLFAVNGQRYELSKCDPSTTLLEFLRTLTPFTGPKLGCGEGGCGACVVLLSTYDPSADQVNEYSISSCLTLLCSLNFCSITTTEGLGNSKDGFHSIHKRIAGFHASQCGFCTPGMCMSLFSALANSEKKTDRPQPPDGFSKITVAEAGKAIAGNICRCTGYRPLVDVCKSYAADVDLEDLGLNSFWNKGDKGAKVNKLPVYSPNSICTFPDFLKSEIKLCSNISSDCKNIGFPDSNWFSPNNFVDLYNLLDSELFSQHRVKIIVSNTSSSIYKDNGLYDIYIDLKGIPELSEIKVDSKGILIGAAISISRAIEVLKEQNGSRPSDEESVFAKIADHMDKVASKFVRNTASIGGNLIMAQRSEFPSDIATILLGAGSTVCLQMPSERVILTLEDFLDRPPCDEKTILVNILIPCWNSESKLSSGKSEVYSLESQSQCSILFETYRAAPRPLGNAIAYLNSAFLAQVYVDKISENNVLDNIHLAFGAYGVEHAIRAKNVEQFLAGKHLTAAVLLQAISLLKETIVPRDGTQHSSYRTSLAVAFVFRFLQPLCKDLKEPAKSVQVNVSQTTTVEHLHGIDNVLFNKEDDGDTCLNNRNKNLALNSKQVIEYSNNYQPVGEPVKKVGAELQASGEAIYVDDNPSPKDCLYGAFMYSSRPLAHIKNISFNSKLASGNLVKFFTVDEIPEGANNFLRMPFGIEPLFAHSLTEYAGQPLGIVIAESQRLANIIAKQAEVDYSTETLESPILSVEDAVERASLFKIPPSLMPKGVGDLSEGMEKADHKIISAKVLLGSQYYFYMETQTALAVPDEDNCIVVYTSTQFAETAHGAIANCLGIPENNVRVITRRVGGGFGGKSFRALQVASACALAAFTLRRPVRMYLDRQTDMIMVGGRHPIKVIYSVGFTSDGKITALHTDILINAGITEDSSPLMPGQVIGVLKKYNWGAFSFDIKLCKTNLTTKSSMRAPGQVQGSYIAEAIIERVASFLSVDATSVRRRNLHTVESLKLYYEKYYDGSASEYTLPSIFDELVSSASYFDHLEAVRHFNSCNKWKKQGISLVPVIFDVMVRPSPGKVSVLKDGSIVVEVGGIEIGQGLWTKVRQMTAFALRQLWDDGSENLLERVRIIQADTLSLIQGGMTVKSTTSEASCGAVRQCCDVLVDRLKSLKERLEKDAGSVSWDNLISQASLQSVNLSASTYWIPEDKSTFYLNYGAAISKVEVDVLTGAITILRTDIIYDCGQSLNPAVDLGQIEGSFVQGVGFFMYEECLTNSDGLVTTDSTWTYKVPSVDTIPKQFNVKILNSGHHKNRVLSSKASGEPPLTLAASVHCATREAIRAARKEFSVSDPHNSTSTFQMDVPTTMPLIKELCGLDNVEKYLQSVVSAE